MSTVGEPIKVKSRVKKSGKKFRAEVGLRADARLCCAGYPVSIGRRAEQESSEKEISCRGLPTGRRPVMFFCRWLLFSSRSSGQVPLARRGSYPMSAWSVSRHPLASRKKERKKEKKCGKKFRAEVCLRAGAQWYVHLCWLFLPNVDIQ